MRQNSSTPRRILLDLVRPERGRLALAAVCMGLGALATAGYAYLVGPVLRVLFLGAPGLASVGAPTGAVPGLAGLFTSGSPAPVAAAILVVAAIKGVAHFGEAVLTTGASQRALASLRARVYAALLRLSPLGPEARARGDLVARFAFDVSAVERAIAEGLVAAIRAALEIAALAGLALYLDPLLALVGLVAFPPAAVLIVHLGRKLKGRRAEVHSSLGDLCDTVDETAAGLSVIRAFGAERLLAGRFAARSESVRRAEVRAAALRALGSPVNEILGAAALALTLVFAAGRIASGSLAPESFVSFFTALFLLYQPVKSLGQAGQALQAGLAALERTEQIRELGARSDEAAARLAGAVPRPERELRLAGLAAGYDGGPDVLVGLDLAIPVGRRVAVVGRSGAGKSTLLYALEGFLPLRNGFVLVDGAPVALAPETARELFAPVPQEPFLFDDTIRVNVRCGRPDADDAEVEEACRAAGVDLFAHALPDGLDTEVGRGGARLSVGQRQRVCLARALVSRAPVLLLDEVTAAWDAATERDVGEGLTGFLAGRTVLAVTHRPSTARAADQVALLEGGAIRALGPLDELVARDPRVASLFGA